MSEEGNRDDATVTLQYLNLRASLLSNLNQLGVEYAQIVSTLNNKTIWPTKALDRTMNLIADKKSYLLDIAKQGLASEDYAHFKDLVDNFTIGYWEKTGLSKKTKTF